MAVLHAETWEQAMVRELLALRLMGIEDFDSAWRRASAVCRNDGKPRPRDWTAGGKDDQGWLPFSTFFRHACRRYWNGWNLDVAGLPSMLEHISEAEHERTLSDSGVRARLIG